MLNGPCFICIANIPIQMADQFIDIIIKSEKMECVVDTGAQISCIGVDMAKRLNLTLLPPGGSDVPYVHGVSSSQLSIVGKVELEFKIGEHAMQYVLHVLEHCHVPVIMGLDILKSKRALIDVDRSQVLFRDSSVVVALHNQATANMTKQPCHQAINETTQTDCGYKSMPTVCGVMESQSVTPESKEFITAKNTVGEFGIKLTETNIASDQHTSLTILVAKNKQTFSKTLQDLGCTHLYEDVINLKDGAQPVTTKYRLYCDKWQETLEKQLKEWLLVKIVSHTQSIWNNPVVVVDKKTGDYRICLDLRILNSRTIPREFPMPTFEEIFNCIAKNCPAIYSLIDLKSAFVQLPLAERSRESTSFTVHGKMAGKYLFSRMIYGLRNAKASFQMLRHEVLGDLVWSMVIVFVDDLLRLL